MVGSLKQTPSAAPATSEDYLTVMEVAARLKLAPKTVRNRMRDGTWQQGVHWLSPRGIAPRFRWSAIVRWLEGGEAATGGFGAAYGPDIPLPRGEHRRRVDRRTGGDL